MSAGEGPFSPLFAWPLPLSASMASAARAHEGPLYRRQGLHDYTGINSKVLAFLNWYRFRVTQSSFSYYNTGCQARIFMGMGSPLATCPAARLVLPIGGLSLYFGWKCCKHIRGNQHSPHIGIWAGVWRGILAIFDSYIFFGPNPLTRVNAHARIFCQRLYATTARPLTSFK
jgi:hypothetical protein